MRFNLYGYLVKGLLIHILGVIGILVVVYLWVFVR